MNSTIDKYWLWMDSSALPHLVNQSRSNGSTGSIKCIRERCRQDNVGYRSELLQRSLKHRGDTLLPSTELLLQACRAARQSHRWSGRLEWSPQTGRLRTFVMGSLGRRKAPVKVRNCSRLKCYIKCSVCVSEKVLRDLICFISIMFDDFFDRYKCSKCVFCTLCLILKIRCWFWLTVELQAILLHYSSNYAQENDTILNVPSRYTQRSWLKSWVFVL